MIKMVNLIVKKEEWSHDEFVEYWMEEHAPIAKQLPGLRKYSTSVPTRPEESEYDGIVELYFDGVSDIGEAFESEAGRKVQEDAENFTQPDEAKTMIVEETVQMDEL